MGILEAIQESNKQQKITFTHNNVNNFIKEFKRLNRHYSKGIVFLVNKEFENLLK